MNHLDIFTQILRMAGVASIVILVVLLVRVLMRRFPRRYAYLMWLVVGIRLVCPVALSSSWSLFNLRLLPDQSRVSTVSREPAAREPGYPAGHDISVSGMSLPDQGKGAGEITTNKSTNHEEWMTERPKSDREDGLSIPDKNENVISDAGQGEDSSLSAVRLLPVAFYIWLAGMVLLLLWNMYLMINMRKRLRKAVLYRDNIYECDDIASPFVFGLFRPRVYIPFRLGEGERAYILRHEQYHIKRRDHLIKLLAFLILTVYWFHPLVWISYVCMVRDMEMSCDEYVLASMGQDIRKEYSQSLLAFATNQRRLSIGMIAFGETNTRKRIRHILNFHKKGKWMGILAGLLVLVVATICLTNGKHKTEETRNVISTGTANSYEMRLLMEQGKKIEDTVSPYNGMYEGRFVLATYKAGEKCDEQVLAAPAQEGVLHFPEKFSFCVRDYDGDGRKDDFALGQPLDSSAMAYYFYTVEENGNITKYNVSGQELIDENMKYMESEGSVDVGQPEYITAEKGEVSPDFPMEYDMPSYSYYDTETGETKKSICTLSKKVEKKRSPDSERKVFQNIEESIRGIAPQQVVEEMQDCIWTVTRTGGVEIYNIINEGPQNKKTFFISTGLEDGKLNSYRIQTAGMEEKLSENRITEEQAYETIQRFAKVFCGKTLEKKDLDKLKNGSMTQSLGEEDRMFSDTQGSIYTVDLKYNMVKQFQNTGLAGADWEDAESAEDQVRIGIWRPEDGAEEPVYFSGGEKMDQLQKLAEKLDPDHGRSKAIEKKLKKEKEFGFILSYKGNEWTVCTGGYVVFLYGRDEKEDPEKNAIMYLPELCKEAERLCREELGYDRIEPSEIQGVISAELNYREKDGTYDKQTLTEKSKLKILEDILSKAEELGGRASACPFGTAVLTLRLKSGKEIQLTWADDSCGVIRINGIYYEYEDRHLSFSPDGIRALFDEIPWRGLS